MLRKFNKGIVSGDVHKVWMHPAAQNSGTYQAYVWGGP